MLITVSVNIAFVNNLIRILKLYFTAWTEAEIVRWNSVHMKYGVWNNLSVVILQLHVNRLMQYASFCSFCRLILYFTQGGFGACLVVIYQLFTGSGFLSPIEFTSPEIKIGVWINSAGLRPGLNVAFYMLRIEFPS